jgi:hypothetical protein
MQTKGAQLSNWLVLLFLGLLLALSAQSVRAQGIVFGEQIPAGNEIVSDVVLNGNDVRLMGVVDGDVFIVGRSVIVDGDVSGSLFVIADRVLLNGTVEGSAYVTAASSQVGETAVVGRSLYFLGLNLLTEQGSIIQRDLYVLTLGARLRGSVERDTQAIIGLVEVVRFILSGVNQVTTGQSVSFLEPGLTVDTRPRGTTYRLQTQTEPEAATPNPQAAAIGEWAMEQVRFLLNILIVGLLLLWLRPNWFVGWSERVKERPLTTFGAGLSIYFIGFAGTVALTLIFIALGATLGLLSFWGLAFTWWGITLSGLSLAFWLFILFVSYISKAVVAYWFGAWLLRRFLPDVQRRIWPLLLGTLLFALLAAIPYAGWALSLIVTYFGLGAVVMTYVVIGFKWGKRPLSPANNPETGG